jgi:hypothetical protein
MLAALRGRTSDRRLRLFAAACCRRIWQALDPSDLPEEIEAAERAADGREGTAALAALRSRLGARGGYSAAWAANRCLLAALDVDPFEAAVGASAASIDFAVYHTLEQGDANRIGAGRPTPAPTIGDCSRCCSVTSSATRSGPSPPTRRGSPRPPSPSPRGSTPSGRSTASPSWPTPSKTPGATRPTC